LIHLVFVSFAQSVGNEVKISSLKVTFWANVIDFATLSKPTP
jgi:hypothetical protein